MESATSDHGCVVKQDHAPPNEIGRTVLFLTALVVLGILGALPGLILAALFGLWSAARWAWRSGRRLFPLPLVVTAVGLAVALAWPQTAEAGQQCGGASWYGNEHHGRTTASGERFDQWGLTAAHRTLPFGTRVRVTLGDRSVTVRINDRGPFIAGRVIDLSRGAADRLGMIQRGVAQVCLEW